MIKRVDNGGQVHLVTNIRKPRKWRRYEYLESSGTLWINTGIKLSLTDKFEFETDFTYSPANGRACPFYGTENYLTGFMAQYHYTNNNLFVVYIKGALFGGSNVSITASSRMYSKTIIDVPNKTWATTYNTTSTSGSYTNLITDTTSTVKFFGNDLYNKYVAKCYYFKIKINDTLVRDFVPAQYNGQYGMWDLVEDKFYPNKGTGTFTVGPEMKNYDEIYEVRKTTSLLPSGVELYDYILSSGTLWIDTNYFADLNKDLEITTESLITSTGRRIVLGNYSGNQNFNLEWNTSNLFRTYLGSDINVTSIGLNTKATAVISWKASSTLLSGNVNGTMFSNVVSSAVKVSTLLFRMFKDTRTTDSLFLQPLRIYKVSIKENGVFVRNWLPCTYLGEPGMWDTVENKFYRNQGTGLFTLGNKITLKEYEYLQSSGTLYINTGFIPKNNDKMEITFIPLNNSTNQTIFGCRTEANNNSLWSYNIFLMLGSTLRLDIVNGASTYTVNTIYTLKYENSVINVNGTNITGPARNGSSVGYKLYLFGTNTAGALEYLSSIKMYNYKQYSNGTLVRDFVPVSYNGTPGLWDKVEWKFYGNAGSGSFTLGPEKKSGNIYLYDHFTNLFNGFIGGGQMTLSNGILVGTGNNSDTYFYTKTTQAVNTTSYYLVGLYVEGYNSATAWTFRSPQSNSNATLKITRDGWNWGYVKFGLANSQPIWDDTTRTFSGSIPKITISDCRIYKIT